MPAGMIGYKKWTEKVTTSVVQCIVMSTFARMLTREKALQKLKSFCDYRDRCHLEVRKKLEATKVKRADHDWIILQLMKSDLLNEERFARSVARGKFRIKGWGRERIRKELTRCEINEYLQEKALEEIDEQTYEATLHELLAKRSAAQDASWTETRKREDLWKTAFMKGYERHLIEKHLGMLKEGVPADVE
jgi:regulatory protein